jgi:hypothetical protein
VAHAVSLISCAKKLGYVRRGTNFRAQKDTRSTSEYLRVRISLRGREITYDSITAAFSGIYEDSRAALPSHRPLSSGIDIRQSIYADASFAANAGIRFVTASRLLADIDCAQREMKQGAGRGALLKTVTSLRARVKIRSKRSGSH